MNIGNMNISDNTPTDTLQFGSVGPVASQSFGQPQQMVIDIVLEIRQLTCLIIS